MGGGRTELILPRVDLEISELYTYSETCANGHLYSETTCIKRPLRDVPKVSAQYIFDLYSKTTSLYIKATMKWS